MYIINDDFEHRDYGNDAILNRSKTYHIKTKNPIIKKIELLGYKNNKIRIHCIFALKKI